MAAANQPPSRTPSPGKGKKIGKGEYERWNTVRTLLFRELGQGVGLVATERT